MSSNSTADRKPMIKYKKAPDAPKRFKSAFIFYSTAKHKEIRERLGREKASTQKTTHIAKVVSQSWKELSPRDREKWLEMARADKARYEEEKANYSGTWRVATTLHPKHPDAPKKPMSAFLAFSNGKRKQVKEANPGLNSAGLSRTLADMWKNAPKDERQKRQEYKEAMNQWREVEDKKLEQERQVETKLGIEKAHVPEGQRNSLHMPSATVVAATPNAVGAADGKTKACHELNFNFTAGVTPLQLQQNNQIPGNGNNHISPNGTEESQNQTSFQGNMQQNSMFPNFNFQGQVLPNQVFQNQAQQMNDFSNQNMMVTMGMQNVPAGHNGWQGILSNEQQQNQHFSGQLNMQQQLSQEQQQMLSVMSQNPQSQQLMNLCFNPVLMNQSGQFMNGTTDSATHGTSDQNHLNTIPLGMVANASIMSSGKNNTQIMNENTMVGSYRNFEKPQSSISMFPTPVNALPSSEMGKIALQSNNEISPENFHLLDDIADDSGNIASSVSMKGDWPPLPNFLPE